MDITHTSVLFIGAWFIQMGAHEGAHAYAAHRLGDDTAHLMGKRSFNPLAHIEWTNLSSLLLSIALPVFTALQGLVPIGMAWVPVNPNRLKKRSAGMAWISFAGPAANLIVVAICFALHAAISPFVPQLHPEDMDSIAKLFYLSDLFLQAIALTSALYGFFNLIPIPPLDGASVLRHWLPEGGQEVLDNMRPYGFFVLIILFWMGDASIIIQAPLEAVGWIWSQLG